MLCGATCSSTCVCPLSSPLCDGGKCTVRAASAPLRLPNCLLGSNVCVFKVNVYQCWRRNDCCPHDMQVPCGLGKPCTASCACPAGTAACVSGICKQVCAAGALCAGCACPSGTHTCVGTNPAYAKCQVGGQEKTGLTAVPVCSSDMQLLNHCTAVVL